MSLDFLDLGGALERAAAGRTLAATVISVSLDQQLHGGWGKEHLSPVPADHRVMADPDAFVSQLLSLEPVTAAQADLRAARHAAPAEPARGELGFPLTLADVSVALGAAAGEQPITLVRVPTSWFGGLRAPPPRSTTSVQTAGRGSARAPGSRSARRSRSREPGGCPLPSSATATT